MGGEPTERMWLKLRVGERRDFTQAKAIRTEKKRERRRERRGEAGLPSKEKVPERDQPKGGCKQSPRVRETETKRDRRRERE